MKKVVLTFALLARLTTVSLYSNDSGLFTNFITYKEAGERVEFYPIGWSHEGNFAYALRWVKGEEAYGQAIIISAITDEILWSTSYFQTKSELFSMSQKVWIELNSQLQLYKIGAGEGIKPVEVPFYSQNNWYEIVKESKGAGTITELVLKVKSSRKGVKSVYTYKPKAGFKMADLTVKQGYISHREERVLLIGEVEWQEPLFENRLSPFIPIGSHLSVGFKEERNFQKDELIDAIYNGQKYLVRKLIREGASVNHSISNGITPLLAAVRVGHWNIALDLIDAGANVNIGDDLGKTPLHYAAMSQQEALVEKLVKRGGDVYLKDKRGKTALAIAREKGDRTIIELMEN